MNEKVLELEKLINMKKSLSNEKQAISNGSMTNNNSSTNQNSSQNNINSSSNTNNNSIGDNTNNSNNSNSSNDNNSNEGNSNIINENSNNIEGDQNKSNLNIYLNVSNENQSSLSFVNNNKNEQENEDNIEMIFIVDKDKYFEEKNILNTFDIKLNVHIDHTQKDKIFFFDYDYKEDSNLSDKTHIYKFKCSDSNCKAIYQLNLNDGQKEDEKIILFNMLQDHSIEYNKHDYYNNPTKGQNKYQEIMTKYPNIKHIQIITVPDNFDYSTMPNISNNEINEENNNDMNDSYQKNQININVDENEEEKYSLESDIYEKNKMEKEEDDDYYSNTSSYKARSRNKDKNDKKRVSKKLKMNNSKEKEKTPKIPKSRKHENKIIEEYQRYMQSGVKQIKKKRHQLYYKPQEYTKFTLSLKNPKYVYAYMPYYKKGREALGKSKAREKWLRFMTFKYGEETTLGPIYYKDKKNG